jgi:hypothetical protein
MTRSGGITMDLAQRMTRVAIRPRRRLAIAMAAAAFVTTACSGSAATPSTASVASFRPSNAPTAAADPSSTMSSTAPSFQPSVRAEPTPIPIGTGPQDQMPGAPGQCDAARPCQFTAGTYQTYGRWAFLPGLTMYIPDGWNSTEQDAGEFNLINPDFPDGNGLFFWRDVIPVEPDGTRVMTVPSTVAGITSWLTANHLLRVSDPMKVVIGKGLDTTTMVVDVPDGTVNKDHVCADIAPKAACFPILTDPAHWDGAWTVVSGESSRYYLATVGPVSNRHLLMLAIVAQADPADERLRFEKAVAPILDSLDVSRVTFN